MGLHVCRVICVVFITLQSSRACSMLSHEAVVDALWDVKLKPALLVRYPNSTWKELMEAHGYAYGGAIIQDLGYYPHGSKQFSDLTHYVRTGAFIEALISESETLDEFAFALGALSHYISDVEVHRFATNPGEPLLYPRLKRKYGNVITYEDNPIAHLSTEFGFDVLEVAKGRFAPEAYHDFIGFNVASGVLERAFHDTYGLHLQDLFPNFHRTIGSYRRAVSKTIPMATRVAWAARKDEIQKSTPGITKSRFVYVMKRSSYERNWGKQYDRPTAGDRALAVIIRLLPPIGPLRALKFKTPTPAVETLFMRSFDRCTGQYSEALEAASYGRLRLEDKNYDVGVITAAGAYKLDDKVQAYWLDALAKKGFGTTTPAISGELLDYYKDPNAPIETRKHPKEWQRVVAELQELRTARQGVTATGQ